MDKTKEQVRREIEETRLRLGDTVDAILHRADVPTRAKESFNESKQRAVEAMADSKQRAMEAVSESKNRAVGSLSESKRRAAGYGRGHPLQLIGGLIGGIVLIGLALYAGWRR